MSRHVKSNRVLGGGEKQVMCEKAKKMLDEELGWRVLNLNRLGFMWVVVRVTEQGSKFIRILIVSTVSKSMVV